jgi:hypothetical protein
MTEFGRLLRGFRKNCKDPDDPEQTLTQERLGLILGKELDTHGGYSGAAISDWERGKSKIHADQRNVLISLIVVLHNLGGLKTLTEAEELLRAGNYRALDAVERKKIFLGTSKDIRFEIPPLILNEDSGILNFILHILFIGSDDGLKNFLNEVEEGPTPSWPRMLVALLRRSLNHLSTPQLVPILLWLWVCFLNWVLILPSLRWPFSNHNLAIVIIKAYVGGTVAVPLLIGLLTDTSHNKFWLDINLTSSPMTRLYTYQGASVGFHLGYFIIFAIDLFGYYIHMQSAVWLDVLGEAVILMLAYVGARIIPYNLWRAYGHLHLADGWVFFIFFLLGPLWGLFFLEYYSFLLNSLAGGLSILFSISLIILLMSWQFYRNKI